MKPTTYFIDIDGTILYQPDDFCRVLQESYVPLPLKDTKEKLLEWIYEGHYIILLTARPENMREMTIKQLHDTGILFDQLYMGCRNGVRVIINDYSDKSNLKAKAINLPRNKGLGEL